MVDHMIEVTFFQGPTGWEVRTNPHPAPGSGRAVATGDTVTWTLIPPDPAVQMQVGFREAFDLSTGSRKRVGPMGPFDNISRTGNTVTGRVAPDHTEGSNRIWRYACVFYRNSEELSWEGGVDTHRPPPP